MERREVALVIGMVILSALACNAPTSTLAPPTEPPPTSTSIPAEASPAPTEGWKVYTNEEAGMSFEYPGHWTLEESRTSAPLEGWRVTGPGFEVYTNFLGGFEEYELLETRAVTLKSGENVEMAIYARVKYVSEDEMERTSERLVLVHVPTMGPYGLILYHYDQSTDPEGLAVIERILATFEVHEPEGGAGEGADWQTYSNPEYRLSFEYPGDWEIRETFVPVRAGGVEGDRPTIILGEVGDENGNDWIRINPRQFQREAGTCREVDGHSICTYSEDPGVIEVLSHIHATFETE